MEQQCKMAENLPRLVANLQGPVGSRYIQFLCTLSLQALCQSDVCIVLAVCHFNANHYHCLTIGTP